MTKQHNNPDGKKEATWQKNPFEADVGQTFLSSMS